MLALVYLLVIQAGLPMWVFVASIALLAIGLPLIVATSVMAQRRGEEPAAGIQQWMTWRRILSGGGLAFGALVMVTGGYAVMRAAGIGPAATLISSGAME